MELDNFNTSIAQWTTLQKLLKEKGINHWNVTNQWSRTTYGAHYKTIPYAMILLQLSKKFVILVWGNNRFKSIEPRHTINAIATALPKVTCTINIIDK